jgi:hypothetical protein
MGRGKGEEGKKDSCGVRKKGGRNPGGEGRTAEAGRGYKSQVNECGPKLKQLVCTQSIGANLAARPMRFLPEHSLSLSLLSTIFFYLFGKGTPNMLMPLLRLSRRRPLIDRSAHLAVW